MDEEELAIPGPAGRVRPPQNSQNKGTNYRHFPTGRGSRQGHPQFERGRNASQGSRQGHPQFERGRNASQGSRQGHPQFERGRNASQGSRQRHPQFERGRNASQGSRQGHPQFERGRNASQGSRQGHPQFERGRNASQGSRQGHPQFERGRNAGQGSRQGHPQFERGRNASQVERPPRYAAQTRHVGFTYLKKIADSADTDIIQNVNNQYDALFELLTGPIEKPDLFVLVMQIAYKVSRSSFDRLKIKFLLDLCNSQFIVYLRTYLMDLPYMSREDRKMNDMYWQRPDDFWESLVAFCEYIITTTPSVAKSKCRSLIEDTSKLCLEKLHELHEYALPGELSSKLDALRGSMKIVEEKMINSKKTTALLQEDPPDDFRELSVLPTRDDLLVQKPFIRPNIIDGAYRDVEHYLDVQFRLLREDCFGPLRDGIYQYINNPTKRRYDNIRVYQNVSFLRPYISNNKIGAVVQVDKKTSEKFQNINWSYSQRLKFGTLILLTKDNCKNFMTVTVMDREDRYLKYGQIPIDILDLSIGDEIYNGELYTMLESEVYFEPYQHVLRALQDPQLPNYLPMKKYIVDVDTQPLRPKYLEHIKEYTYKNESGNEYLLLTEDDENTIVFQPNEDIWPSRDDLGLNESQYEAYKVALTYEFAVIQGPPGTGKTHIGVEIAKTLLWNVSDVHLNKRFKCVMLLVCYTNHALDQFLEALLPYTDSIARIGGQSKNKALDDYNLSTLKKKHRSYGFCDLRSEVNSAMSQLSSLQNIISEAHNGVLNMNHLKIPSDSDAEFREYRELYNSRQRESAHGSPMELWLFENMIIDYYELIDEDNISYEIQQYVRDLNYKDDDERSKELNTLFCFSLEEASKNILTLVLLYLKEMDLQKRVGLQRKIAKLRGQIRLFTEMRDAYFNRGMNAHNIPNVVYDRWMKYFHWVDEYKEEQNQNMIEIKKKASALLKDYEEARLIQDCEILSNVKIIGITTTGAARLRKMLQNIGPPIVIVEEAAEVLEQHIITSLSQNCQHLILIGDHKQLRPSAAHMCLARQYNIEVSLFERMILNSVHSRRLCVQHRMRPEFARLIAPHIYPDLENHPSVGHFPDVRGITTNLFFFTHDHKELAEADSSSKSNPKEADMVLLLANYLMQQGYDANDVTILAAYSGQMFYMRKERINHPHLDRVKITLVDNYQGEESKIILLSLVRNNDDKRIGFLGTENRICVALSRAREGFYIFGNIELLKTKSTLWSTIYDVLNEGGHVGTSLPLRCEKHQDEINMISSAEGFKNVPEGGCLLPCEFKLKCGHQCPLLCHSYGRDHEAIQCRMNCERKCENDHPCQLKCRIPCLCKVQITKKFPCGHENTVSCYEDPEVARCHTVLEVALPFCGHKIKKQCWQNINQISCTVPCDHRLDCGHQCLRNCHVQHDPLHEKYECRKPCARAMYGCSNTSDEVPDDHLCKKMCYQKCDECNVQVKKKRSTCAHQEVVACSKDIELDPCKKKCTRMLPCGHFCKQMCSVPCGNCTQMVKKVVAECQHDVTLMCKVEPTRAICTKRCGRMMSCGHACEQECRDECDPEKCAAPATDALRAPCGHDVRPPCAEFIKFTPGGVNLELLSYCRAACGAPLQCEHACAGNCGSCRQGRLHEPCAQPCGRLNLCGHICAEPCSKVCPPCRKPCEVRCVHSKCTEICGAPCYSCKERCVRACAHGRCRKLCGQKCDRAPCTQRCERRLACGHACCGYCGEPCPDVCKICRPDDFPRDFLGDEFEDDAIFVRLEDCGHVLHSEDMENLMNGDQETIGVRKCPFCRSAILNTQRYRDTIRDMFNTKINPVKNKIYGNKNEILQKRQELLEDLKGCFAKIFVLPPVFKDLITKPYRVLASSIKGNKRSDNPQLETYKLSLNAINLLFEYCQDYSQKTPVSNLHERILKTPTIASISIHLDYVMDAMVIEVKTLCIYLCRNVNKLSVQQQEDYRNELKRVHAMINLSQVIRHPIYEKVRTSSIVTKAENEAKSVILGWKIYDHDAGTKALKALQEATKISYTITVKEREMVVKAIGMGPGHWFTCPNGHYYCIGECGGAMQMGRCPDCKADVGGTSHRLLSTNRHAGDIDGSRYAAFSEEANNMANFDLNNII